jgi:hypothetical protein
MIKEIGHEMIHLFERWFEGRLAQFVILWGVPWICWTPTRRSRDLNCSNIIHKDQTYDGCQTIVEIRK